MCFGGSQSDVQLSMIGGQASARGQFFDGDDDKYKCKYKYKYKNTKYWYTIDALGAIFAIFTRLLQNFYNTITILL